MFADYARTQNYSYVRHFEIGCTCNVHLLLPLKVCNIITAQKIRGKLGICSNLLKKSVMKNFSFCALYFTCCTLPTGDFSTNVLTSVLIYFATLKISVHKTSIKLAKELLNLLHLFQIISC